MIKSWENLEVWQRAHALTLRVYETTKSFPADERFRMVDQLCRASVSVCANIAEGKGRKSLKEYIRFLTIASGSIEETKYFLLLAKDLRYVTEEEYNELIEEANTVARMLNALLRSLYYLKPRT